MHTRRLALCLLLALIPLTSCAAAPAQGDAAQAPTAATPADATPPAPAATRSRALLISDGRLVEVDEHGEVTRERGALTADWCQVDSRAGALWTQQDHDLMVLDLEDPSPTLRRVATLPEMVTLFPVLFQVVYPEARLPEHAPERYQVVVQLEMDPDPRLRGAIGCEGDMAWYCYGGESLPEPGHELDALDASLKQAVAALDAVVIDDPALLTHLNTRGAARPLWSPSTSPADAPPRLTNPSVIDAAACEDGGCGAVEALPGTPYWTVVTANSRGDFYHEVRHLYDPRSARFIDPSGALDPAPAPFADSAGAIGSGVVAPSGQAISQGAQLVHFTRGQVFEGDVFCGWVGGGHPFSYLQ